jgi:predicted RNA-binding protein with EMAP domain
LPAAGLNLQEILNHKELYDRKVVEIIGEVTGVAVKSGKGYFIQLNQDSYAKKSLAEGGDFKGGNIAIAVYLSPEDFRKITYRGNYHFKGDLVRVKGIYHAACKEHRGETDIHALEIKVIKKGYKIKHNLDTKFAILVLFIFLSGIVLFVFSRLREARAG